MVVGRQRISSRHFVLDLFAGIGGFRLGMESAGHECIGISHHRGFGRAGCSEF